MNWKLKSKIQNSISFLPRSTSDSIYYFMQKQFGELRKFNPIATIITSVGICKHILESGGSLSNKVFFEIGTGRAPIAPLVYWLIGAKKTITIDINSYVKKILIKESLNYISNNQKKIIGLFGSLLILNRFKKLLKYNNNSKFSLISFFDLTKIDYITLGDASKTDLIDNSVDFHTSISTLEHIPKNKLKDIFIEGNRIIKKDGFFIHRIDYSDHFSHSDNKISEINFLQFSNDQWKQYSNNQFMFMNRLRHDDFINLLNSVGHKIIKTHTNNIDEQSNNLLVNGVFHLDKQFSLKPHNILAIRDSWILSQKPINK